MGRTSIPCSNETRNRAKSLKGPNKYDEFLADAFDAFEAVYGDKDLDELNMNSNSEELAEKAELSEQINSLRRELDEFKSQMPREVAEELR